MLNQEAVRTSLSKVKSIPGLNFISPSSTKTPTKIDLEGFQRAQALAYEAAVSVTSTRPKWSRRSCDTLTWAALPLLGFAKRATKPSSHSWCAPRLQTRAMKTFSTILPPRSSLLSSARPTFFSSTSFLKRPEARCASTSWSKRPARS